MATEKRKLSTYVYGSVYEDLMLIYKIYCKSYGKVTISKYLEGIIEKHIQEEGKKLLEKANR